MEQKRLLLSLSKGQKILFKLKGHDEVIGGVSMDDSISLPYVRLIFEFPETFIIVRSDVKKKF